MGCTPVSATYFETLGIPLEAGRPFSTADTSSSPRVAIVNAAMAPEKSLTRRILLFANRIQV